jgi:hypothetical protein
VRNPSGLRNDTEFLSLLPKPLQFRRGKNLKILLTRTPYSTRQFFVRMGGKRWPADGRGVSLTRVLTALRKALVKATN